jgi:hypothetical protein
MRSPGAYTKCVCTKCVSVGLAQVYLALAFLISGTIGRDAGPPIP